MILQPENKRYQLHFNGVGYSASIEQLKAQIKRLERSEELLKSINKELQSQARNIAEVEQEIQALTGFKNLDLAAQALGVEKEYRELSQVEEAGYPPKGAVEKKDGKYIPKQKHLNDLKESHTTYLPEEMREAYDRIDAACEVINEFDTMKRHSIDKRQDGSHVINIHRFFQSRSYEG